MAVLNSDCPLFTGFVKRSYYTHKPEDDQVFEEVMVFGVQSVADRILTFHCMWDFGMVRSRVPISSIYWKKPDTDVMPHFKQLWNCNGEDLAVTTLSFLSGKRCQVILKDKTWVWGTYQFTIDWYNNEFSMMPDQYKAGHVIFADHGYLLCQPNNRIRFHDMNWVTKDFPVDPKEIKVDKAFINVEAFSDRWVSQDGDSFYYDVESK